MVHPEQPTADGREPLMLAIDTSTERAGIALAIGDDVRTRSWDAGRTQTTSLLPAIDEMLQDAGQRPSSITSVTVAMGPGTFTGLRVGMSIAKGIVLARNIPLIGIPTLETAAAGVPDAEDLVAVLPAGRGRVVWQRFRSGHREGPRNTTLPELVAALEAMRETLVTGELAEAQRATVETAHPHVRWQHRDPAVLVRLAMDRLRRGDVDDPVTLEPLYLHGVVVQAGPVQDRLRKAR